MNIKTFEALASGETLELRIYGPIGADFFGGGVSAESISAALQGMPHAKTILLRISSPGGNAYDGMAIRSMLAAHPAEKVCEVEGLAASAGSIIAMACGTIRMHTGSALMIHEASARIADRGVNADDLRKMLAGIETLNDGMASVYAERTGLKKDAVREMMSAETWLTPDQAIAQGFADEQVAGTLKVAASFDLSQFGYRHVPEQFASMQDAPLFSTEEVAALRELISAGPGEDEESGDAATDDGESDEDESAEEDDDESEDDTVNTGLPESPAVQTTSQPVPPQVAVASTAEAFADRKRSNNMTIKLIAQAVGLQADADESAVFAAVNRAQSMFAELRTLTAASDLDGVLGAVRGLVESAKQVPVLQAQVASQAKSLEEQERQAIFAADANDPAGRKLTPATQAFWAERPVSELKAFLAAAPHVVVVQQAGTKTAAKQPAVTSVAGTPTSGSTEPLKFNGKAYEELSPQERHNLHVENPEMFAALRTSYVERGSPRAQSQQQRASA
jgi:ATP-dependent protease ClpP protease subunit